VKRKKRLLQEPIQVKRVQREDPIKKWVRKLTVISKNRLLRNDLLEKEIDINLDRLLRRCKEFNKEPPSLLAKLEAELNNYPNTGLFSLLDYNVLRLRDHPDWWVGGKMPSERAKRKGGIVREKRNR
jgi:hypothetical protein